MAASYTNKESPWIELVEQSTSVLFISDDRRRLKGSIRSSIDTNIHNLTHQAKHENSINATTYFQVGQLELSKDWVIYDHVLDHAVRLHFELAERRHQVWRGQTREYFFRE